MSAPRTAKTFLYRALVVVVVAGAALGVVTSLVIPALAKWQGYQLVEIMTGSMNPAIAPHSTIAIKTGATPAAGDVVTMKVTDGYLTHRVVRIADGQVTTKGDANATEDPWTTPTEQVVGVVNMMPASLTRLDYLATSALGRALLFLPALALFAFVELRDLRRGRQEPVLREQMA